VYRSTAIVATVSVKKTKVGSSYAMVDFLIIMRCIYPLLVAATLISFEGKESNRSPADGSNLFCPWRCSVHTGFVSCRGVWTGNSDSERTRD
jgi:hypothetical protein